MQLKGRTGKALLGAMMTYGQFAIALVAAFFVTPLILRKISARDYGLWLSSGEILSYLMLLDFGVFAVLPWLVARADGRKRPDELKSYLVHALVVAGGAAGILLLVSLAGGGKLAALIHFTPSDWSTFRDPLCLLVVLLALNLPVSVFVSLLGGLQDVKFHGTLGLLRTIIGPLLTVALLVSGHGFYALAIGTASVAPLAGIAALVRGRIVAPQLFSHWPRPSLSGAAQLFRESVGAWLASAGVQLMERSSAIILTFLRFPALVPVLVCTSRLGRTLTQMAWVMPDSALVGFAQLGGENNVERTREVALSIIKLTVVLAGLPACIVLAINPAFVRIWVGPKFFGGLTLNLLLAAEVISGSFVHALATVVAVHGHRLQVGLATLVQGALYIVSALLLSNWLLLEGLIIADLVAPLCSTVPTCLLLLHSSLGLTFRRLATETGSILFLYTGPCLILAAGYGYFRSERASLAEVSIVGLAIAVLYVRVMAAQIVTFPLPASVKMWVQRLRFIQVS
jgi:O-antigen/teichoic acid export membrane protein